MKRFVSFSRGFSTSVILLINEKTGHLTREEKDELLKDLKSYEDTHPKPSFVNPGYPDYDNLVKKSRSHEEYERAVEKFKNKHSVDEDMKCYDEDRCNDVTRK
jgi:hypothetical protein